VGRVTFLCDELVGLVRKKRNYDCFDDKRYNEVDDVEVLVHEIYFNSSKRCRKPTPEEAL
jgi:hypothetical protein